jgi:hypothetical protein
VASTPTVPILVWLTTYRHRYCVASPSGQHANRKRVVGTSYNGTNAQATMMAMANFANDAADSHPALVRPNILTACSEVCSISLAPGHELVWCTGKTWYSIAAPALLFRSVTSSPIQSHATSWMRTYRLVSSLGLHVSVSRTCCRSTLGPSIVRAHGSVLLPGCLDENLGLSTAERLK